MLAPLVPARLLVFAHVPQVKILCGKREIAQNAICVRVVLERLRRDPEIYVRKSVANVLRDGSRSQAAFVLRLCAAWARSPDPATQWSVRHGLRRLASTHAAEVARLLATLPATSSPSNRGRGASKLAAKARVRSAPGRAAARGTRRTPARKDPR